MAVLGMSSAAYAQSIPLGARIYQSVDTEHNTVTKIMGEVWADGKNSQDGVIRESKLQPYYEDNDIKSIGRYETKPVLQITTTTSEKAGGYYNFPKSISLRNKSIRFWVKASDWKQIQDMNLILSTGDDTFEHSLTLDLTTKLHNQTNDHWVEVTASISNFEAYNNPDIDNIKSVLWQVRDKGNKRVTTTIDKFSVIDNGVNSRISITIDDGLADNTVAKQIMDKYNIKGTLFIDPTAIGTKGYLTQAQIDKFASDGWDIGGHDVNYTLKAMSQAEIDDFMDKTAAYLKKHNYKGAEYFAFPGGINDPRVNESVSKHFKYGLNVDGTTNPGSVISNMRINRKSVDKYTTVDMVKQWVDDAKKNNEYLILNFHTFSNTSTDDENVKPADFEAIVKYISNTQIEAKPVSNAVAAIETVQSNIPPQDLEIADIGATTLLNPKRQDFGVGIAQTRFSNPNASYLGQEAQFLSNYNDGEYALKGGIGVGTLNNRNYLVGDMTGMKFLNSNSMVSLGVSGDIVNSVNGLAQGISQSTVTAGYDYYNDVGGISISGFQNFYTDGNKQTGGTLQPYVYTSVPGVYVYVKEKYYATQNPNDPNYYSPGNYSRTTGGVGWRKAVGENVYSGWADYGTSNADGYHSPAWSAKFAVDHVENKSLTYGVAVGTDVSSAGNYQYFYGDVHLKYTF